MYLSFVHILQRLVDENPSTKGPSVRLITELGIFLVDIFVSINIIDRLLRDAADGDLCSIYLPGRVVDEEGIVVEVDD